METKARTVVNISATVNAPVTKTWDYWTNPDHMTKWNHASDDWHSPWAKSDFREGGQFSARMEAKDGSMGFEFGGVYNVIRNHEYIEFTMGDGRKVKTSFSPQGETTVVTESFEAEDLHPVDFQRMGWQAILDNFKKYTEAN
jgi:uncharacterized protein YndB with AHSA1/START domain